MRRKPKAQYRVENSVAPIAVAERYSGELMRPITAVSAMPASDTPTLASMIGTARATTRRRQPATSVGNRCG